MKVAWLFPGQGSQFVGMGRDLRDASPAAREIFTRVDEALKEPLSRCIFEGPDADLTLTVNAQPAIVAVSCALLAALKERIPSLPEPHMAAGHSLGEYSALVASGALELEDAVRLVRARGRAMQEAVPPGSGAMAAVMGLEAEPLEALCREAAQGEVVACANFNAPGQIVVAGTAGAVERLSLRVAEAKGKVIPLKVSAPFHCALMAPAARAVARELDRITIAKPKFPIVANVDARPNEEAEHVKPLLVRQVDGPIRWEEGVRTMAASGVTHALEIGPGKVLAGLTKRIVKSLKVHTASDLASIDAAAPFLAG